MITYTPLWETMKRKGIIQYRLMEYYGVSATLMSRMKIMYVSAHTLEIFCKILDCRMEDVIEIRND